MIAKPYENGLCTYVYIYIYIYILKVTQLAFSCLNSTIYDVNVILLCEECSINTCGQNSPKTTEKKLNVENGVHCD